MNIGYDPYNSYVARVQASDTLEFSIEAPPVEPPQEIADEPVVG
jgi:hypothetical protein